MFTCIEIIFQMRDSFINFIFNIMGSFGKERFINTIFATPISNAVIKTFQNTNTRLYLIFFDSLYLGLSIKGFLKTLFLIIFRGYYTFIKVGDSYRNFVDTVSRGNEGKIPKK